MRHALLDLIMNYFLSASDMIAEFASKTCPISLLLVSDGVAIFTLQVASPPHVLRACQQPSTTTYYNAPCACRIKPFSILPTRRVAEIRRQLAAAKFMAKKKDCRIENGPPVLFSISWVLAPRVLLLLGEVRQECPRRRAGRPTVRPCPSNLCSDPAPSPPSRPLLCPTARRTGRRRQRRRRTSCHETDALSVVKTLWCRLDLPDNETQKKNALGGLLFRERNVPSDVQLLVQDDGGERCGEQLSTVQPCRSSALASLIFTLSCRLIN